MKKLIVIFTALLLTGCVFKKAGVPSESQNEKISVNGNQNNLFLNEDGTHKWRFYADESLPEEERSFFIDGNSCIFGDYILGKVEMFDDSLLVVAVGSHCHIKDKILDGMIGVDPKKTEIINFENFKVGDVVRIYYNFPEGFTPTDYLDYLDYSSRIELDV